MIKFVVVEEELTLLLSRKAAEKMKLITVNYDKFQSVSGVVEDTHDTQQDLKPDPSKVESILKLESSKTKLDIERISGTANYLANPNPSCEH